jgi:TonB-dependent starch-binding outer membrane protein SusC
MKRKTFKMLFLCFFASLLSFVVFGQYKTEKVNLARLDSCGLEGVNALSPDELLKGRFSGIRISDTDGNPMGAKTTTIRGINSMKGNSEPLWIVDGTVLNPSNLEVEPMFWQSKYSSADFTSVQNTLGTINPYDIENIRIIKDISGTAQYGIKGANGVIIITTKQAKQSDFSVSLNSDFSFATSEPGVNMLNLTDYINFQQQLGKNITGLTNQVDWTDQALNGNMAFSQNHSIGISGREKKLNYYLSGFYSEINGTIKRNESTLGGVRLNLDMEASRLFSFGTRIGLSFADISMTKGANPFGQLSTISSIKSGVPDLNALNSYSTWQADYDDNSKENRFIPSIYFDINPLKGLKLSTTIGADYRGKDRSTWLGNGTPLGMENNGAASLSSLVAFCFDVKSVLSFTLNSENSTFTVSGGTEYLDRTNSFNTMNGTDFFSHELRAKGINLASSKANIHKFSWENRQYGLFGSLSYDFNHIFGLNGTLRADRTLKQEGRFNLYPAIDGWINLINRTQSENEGLISSAKFSTGWGKAGNSIVTPYEFFNRYNTGNDYNITTETAPFYEMLWKTQSNEFNLGFTAGFLNERVLLSAKYYNRKTDDNIILNCFGEPFGNNDFWRYTRRSIAYDFMGSLSNRGYEFDLNADIISGEKWSWSITANGTFNDNQVDQVVEGYLTGNEIGQGIAVNYNRVGHPVSSLYGYQATGIATTTNVSSAPAFNGKVAKPGDVLFKDMDGDKNITETDKAMIGNPHPKFFGGICTEISFNHFSLEMQVEGVYGHDILNIDRLMQENVSGTGNVSAEAYSKAFNFTNVPDYPSINATGTGQISSRYVEKGNYTRLSLIKAEYDVPVHKMKWIQSLKLSLGIHNALTISSFSGWNPEINSFGYDNSRLGIAVGAFPEMKNFTLGVHAAF